MTVYTTWYSINNVTSERGCTFGVGHSTLRQHHASATEVALASGSTSGGFQDGYPGLPVTVQRGSTVSVSWSLTKVVVSYVLPHQGRALWDELTATVETGVLQLQVRSCGTAFATDLRQADTSFQRFNRLLQTFLFGCWDRGALRLTVKAAPHKFSFLLTLHYTCVNVDRSVVPTICGIRQSTRRFLSVTRLVTTDWRWPGTVETQVMRCWVQRT